MTLIRGIITATENVYPALLITAGVMSEPNKEVSLPDHTSDHPQTQPLKRCRKCQQEYPATTEYFVAHKSYGCGLKARCRQCEYEYLRQYRKTHRHKVNQQARDYYHRNPIKKIQYNDARRRKDRGKVFAYFNDCCAVCGRPQGLWHKIVIDHWIPLSRGGATMPDNLVPLCHGIDGCNNSKGSRDAHEWLLERYTPRKVAKIEKRIAKYFKWIHDQEQGL